MLLENVRCPHCGAPLQIGSQQQVVFCEFCGSRFQVRRDAALERTDLLTIAASARWLDELLTVLEAGKSAADARHQREMWRLEHEAAWLSFWPLCLVTALVIGMVFILTGGYVEYAGAVFVVAGIVLSWYGWRAQSRHTAYEQEVGRKFVETMAGLEQREQGIRRSRTKIQTQIESLLGAM
jgi:hypothetical protein